MITKAVDTRVFIAVVLVTLTTLFGAVWLYTKHDRRSFLEADYGQWSAKSKILESCGFGKVVILGDSRADAAILPRTLGIAATNLALTGATPVEISFQVAAMMKCANHPDTALIVFAPRQFEEIDWFWEHAARYGFLSFADLQDVAEAERRLGTRYLYHGAFGSEPPPLVKNWLYYQNFPAYDFASLMGALGGRRLTANERIESETLANDGQHEVGSFSGCVTVPAWEANQSVFEQNPLIMTYFARMIAALKEAKVKMTFASPPFSKLSMSRMSSVFMSQYETFIRQVVAGIPDARFVGDVFPVLDDCLFDDLHHVSPDGAERFSKDLKPLIATAASGAY